MRIEKGIAYCGLACCVCKENETCTGCKNDGCKNSSNCSISKCCKDKGIEGCYACSEFPCGEEMLQKLRVYGFQRFIQEYGEYELLKFLKSNEQKGIVYHYPGQLIGDYDVCETYEELKDFIINGKPKIRTY